MRTRSLAICNPFGWRMFNEMPRFPAFLLLNWPPMSESRTPADLPARLAAEPFAGRVAKAAAVFGVLDIGKGLAYQPMLVERVLVRFAQRRPEEAGILRLAPRHVGVGPGADKALHDVEHM